MLTAFLAVAVSALLIFALCLGDPKRRRAARTHGKAQRTTVRRLLVTATCLPGLALALSGDAAAFLVWLGGAASIGWLITLWFSRTRPIPASVDRSA